MLCYYLFHILFQFINIAGGAAAAIGRRSGGYRAVAGLLPQQLGLVPQQLPCVGVRATTTLFVGERLFAANAFALACDCRHGYRGSFTLPCRASDYGDIVGDDSAAATIALCLLCDRGPCYLSAIVRLR